MIYSGVTDNWDRVRILHDIAKDYYAMTKDSKHRKHQLNQSDEFYFNLEDSMLMDKEACIVGMIIVWSTITIESLVNHAIAETSDNKETAIEAIEHPENLNIWKKTGSSLAKKLLILSNGKISDKSILTAADDISNLRNDIVHDKPIEYIDIGKDDVEVHHYRSRGKSETKWHM